MLHRNYGWLVLASLVFVTTTQTSADELRDAKRTLSKLGIRVSGSYLLLSEEMELGTKLRATSKLKKAIARSGKDSAGLEKKLKELQKLNAELKKRYVQANAQLARTNPANTNQYNRLVTIVNTTGGQISLARDEKAKLLTQKKDVAQEVSMARQNYILNVLDMRILADKLSKTYVSKADDENVKIAIAKLSELSEKVYRLVPSRTFKAYQKQLRKLEQTVLSESIPLRKGRSGGLFVTVMFNGKHAAELVVDSGATLVVLPIKVAESLGVTPKINDPDLILRIANGERISAKRVTIPEMRVGPFIAENVECAVLGPEAPDAPSLLGMAFLGQFQFNINAQAGTLTLSKESSNSLKKSR